jgi:hypothetical protein
MSNATRSFLERRMDICNAAPQWEFAAEWRWSALKESARKVFHRSLFCSSVRGVSTELLTARPERRCHLTRLTTECDNYKTQRNLQNLLQIIRGLLIMERMMYPRRFVRVRPGGRNSDLAKLIVGPKAPVVDCRVVDYSPGGACLEISGQTKLPNRFELLFGGTKKRCRVVWSAGRRVGVAF